MCSGNRDRQRRQAEREAREAQREADERARRAQAVADRQAAEREQIARNQVAERERLATVASSNAATQKRTVEAATFEAMRQEQGIRDNAAAEEASILAENKRRVGAIRTAGGAMSASMVALNADKKDAKAPTAGSTKGKPKAAGPRATSALVQRGSARIRGTNLSI